MRALLISTVTLMVLTAAHPGQADRMGNEPYYSEHHMESFQRQGMMPKGLLPSGAGIHAGESLRSPNGEFQLSCQRDGNLVLYRKGRPLWSSGTAGWEVRECVMQRDGNFVLYGRGRDPVWASNTQGNPGSFLAVQDDGNVVIYRPAVPIWASGTSR